MLALAPIALALASALAAQPVAAQDDHLVSSTFTALQKRGIEHGPHGKNNNGPQTKLDSYNITFLHVNDNHAHLDEFRSSGTDCPRNTTELHNVTKVPCFGGSSRILSKVKEIRKEVKNTMLLNAGDEFQGTLFYNFYGGEKLAEAMNALDYDLFTLGNHEFDSNTTSLSSFLSSLNAPTVSSNVRSSDPLLGALIHPFLHFPEHELAVVAVTTTSVPDISSPGNGTQFLPYVSTLQPLVNGLLKSRFGLGQGKVKRIVAVTHIGYDEDVALAKATRGIHLIIGGHSHTRLGPDSAAAGKYPTIVKNLDGEDVMIVTAWRWGAQLGRIEVAWDKNSNNVLAYTGSPINMTEEIKQDETLQNEVLEWREPFDAYGKVVVGQTATNLDQSTCRTQECTLGNAVTDSMLYARKQLGASVDFALHNSGGIRATIEAPTVTRGDILTSFPFGNNLVDMQFSGSQLWEIFEGVVSGVNSVGKTVTSFVQVSQGVAFTYNPSAPVGSRLITLQVGSPTLAPIVADKIYTVVTLDFISTGGDAIFPQPLKAPPPGLGSQSDIFEAWVTRFTPLDVQVEGRIKTTTETAQQKP